jgi:hypothetical protein
MKAVNFASASNVGACVGVDGGTTPDESPIGADLRG